MTDGNEPHCPAFSDTMNVILRTFLLLAVIGLAPFASADWPTYLHDITRVGHTQDAIKAPLTERWVYEAPSKPQLAWAGEDGKMFEDKLMLNRVHFDDVLHVAIVGDRLYFGSSVDGRVFCKNLLTGAEEWTFFTDAPVRLAPMVVDGRLYIGSDDGHVYCLNAKSGSVIWKLRAGPADERILARGRMISRWPVRTGVLVDDGIAYFGAGVFPHETVYLYAVDAKTGKVLWKNDSISQQDAGRNDLSPQGYLLATKDTLFVPSGRSMAASFTRAKGEFLVKPEPGWRGDAGGQIGGTQAFLADDQIYAVGEHHILALDQEKQKTGFGWFRGRQMTLAGDMGYMANGTEITAIDRLKHAKGTQDRQQLEMAAYKVSRELRNHPAVAEAKKLQAAESDLRAAEKALAALAADDAQRGKAQADVIDQKAAVASIAERYEPLRMEYQAKKDKIASDKDAAAKFSATGVKWTYPTPLDSALILAGDTLVAGGKGEVICLDAGSGKLLWQAKVEGDARGLAAANGHLVVSTSTGRIYTFSDSNHTTLPLALSGKETEANSEPFAKDELSERYAIAAENILKESGITKGFCLVLGNEQGRLAYELAKRSELVIFGVDADAKKVAAARAALAKTNLYGPRVTFDHLDLSVIPYASYFANLVVSDSVLVTGEVPGAPTDVARHLKPIGGQFCFGVPESTPDDVKTKAKQSITDWLAATKLLEERAKMEIGSHWARLTRGPLPGAGGWSHQYGNAANTSSNEDQRIKGGLSVLWYGDPGPGKMVNRHNGAVGPLSVNGRLFIQGDEAVMAYDAYNGQQLWEVPNPGALRTGVFAGREPGNMAATDDALFMVNGFECVQFDAATGRTVHKFPLPGAARGKNLEWGYLAHAEGMLYGTATQRIENAAQEARRGQNMAINTDLIFAYDVKSRDLKWSHQGQHIAHATIAIGDGRIFFVDSSLTPQQREDMLRQDKTELAKLTGEEQKIAEERVKKADLRLAVALDAATGKGMWAKPVDVTDCSDIGDGGGSLSLIYQNGHLVLGGANANGHYWTQFLEGKFERRRLVVLDAGRGDKLWAKDANYRHRPITIGNEIIAEPWGYDLYTGAQKMRTHPLTGEQTPWMFARPGHHCGAISATPNMMFFRSKFTAFYNRDTDQGTEHFAGQRLGCWINTIPANGLVMIPEASAGCVCLFSIASTIVFEPRDGRMNWGVYSANGLSTPVQHMALNLGAPGDRRDAHGKLWLGWPRPSSRAGIDLPLDLKPKYAKGGAPYSFNADSYEIAGTETPWVFSSGLRGMTQCEVPLIAKDQKPDTFTVRLMFAALESDKAGQRVFDVKLQGHTVLKDLDIVTNTGGVKKAHVAEFKNIQVADSLVIELTPAQEGANEDHQPLLSGIEILRTNAEEIRETVAGR
jgi:outer membrane protein assembly factor BamB